MITQWWSKHSIYPANDYKRCVCESWEPNNPDCLLESETCDIDDNEDNDENDNNDDDDQEENNDDNEEEQDEDEEDNEDNNDEDEEDDDEEEEEEDIDDDDEEDESEVNHWIGHNWQVDYKAVDGVLQGVSE